MDTGVYTATNAITLTAAFSGPATNPVVIAGSPNRAAGGSVFRSTGNPRPMGFDFRAGASNLIVRDIVLSNVVRGVTLSNVVNVVLDGVEVRGATSRAFEILNHARNVELIHCVAHGGGIGVYLNQATNICIRHGVYWNNTANAIYVGAGVGVQVENSVLASTVSGAALYSVGVTNGFESDYNNLFVGPRSQVGAVRAPAATADSLVAWQRLLRRDIHSLPQDPLLADPERFDYHPKTVETLGRVLPNGERTSDTVTSPLIDAGNPASDFSAEPMPNGGRVNIGRHGGTAEASLTPSLPWIQPLTLADGGGVSNGMYEMCIRDRSNAVNVVLDGVEVRGATFRAFEILNYANNLELIHCVAHGGGTGVYSVSYTHLDVYKRQGYTDADIGRFHDQRDGNACERYAEYFAGPPPKVTKPPETSGLSGTPVSTETDAALKSGQPFWSVMIPVGACAELLRDTLASVLNQDAGDGRMAIEVVANEACGDEIKVIVDEVGRGRVRVHFIQGMVGRAQRCV